MIEISLHTRLVSELRSKVRRRSGERSKWEAQRMATLALLTNQTMRPPALPVQVALVAHSPQLVSVDWVRSRAQPFIHGVADWFGIEHDDSLIRWQFWTAHSERHAVGLTVDELRAERYFRAPGQQQLTGLALR